MSLSELSETEMNLTLHKVSVGSFHLASPSVGGKSEI